MSCSNLQLDLYIISEPRGGQTGAVVRASDFGRWGPWFEPWPGAVRCGLE